MSERLDVDAPSALLAFLAARLPGWSKTTLRQRLQLGCVRVNGAVARRGDHALAPGDAVEVAARGEAPPPERGPRGLPVLHCDDDLVAVDKPAGLLSVATDSERERTALAIVREWLTRPGRRVDVWPAHRLDRETSGVLLLARTREAKEVVQASWESARKVYLAVVEGVPDPGAGLVDQPLWEDDAHNVHVGSHDGAREARTRYRTLEHGAGRALLEVELETGRRHQIRAHLAWLGHPVVGDPRHGTRGGRMALHALRLEVDHPRDGRRLVVEAPVPRGFTELTPRR